MGRRLEEMVVVLSYVVKVFFAECRTFCRLEFMIAVSDPFGSIWTQYRSIVYSSMLSTFLLVLGVENTSISEHQYENVPQQ